jgi:hypothetical protein
MLQIRDVFARLVAVGLVLLVITPPQVLARASNAQPAFQQKELDAILAPIALYPDALLAQIFMASTYPLEVVQAERWVKQNPQLEGDALTAALEQQPWDPSVKSLVNFPQVLSMMSEQLDWMTKLGDAFVAQQKDVMETVQTLRAKAHAAGNLKTTAEQQVIVEKQVIRIESPHSQVVYVPVYNPSIIYGTWWYPAYPPYVYYPPDYVVGTTFFSFGVGVFVGAAWGYAWGRCDWHRHHIHIDIHRNISVNRHINRRHYHSDWQRRGYISGSGRGTWRHHTVHRKGVAYRDRAMAQRFNSVTPTDLTRARESFRNRIAVGQPDLSHERIVPYTSRQRDNRVRTYERRNSTATGRREHPVQRQRSYVHTNRGETRSQVGARSYNRYAPGVEHGNRTRLHSDRSRPSPSITGGSSSRFDSRVYGSIRGR